MMANILSEIVDRKREIVARLRADPATRDFRDRGLAARANATPHALLRALVGTPRCPESFRESAQRADPTFKIIAEFKRRSPSAGTIRSNLSATDVATRYERGGACAISVLTDEQYFGGSILDLAAIRAITALPLLRKDFIIDEIQIYEAAAAGADAVLLIAAALNDDALAKLRATTEEELGLDLTLEDRRIAARRGLVEVGLVAVDLHVHADAAVGGDVRLDEELQLGFLKGSLYTLRADLRERNQGTLRNARFAVVQGQDARTAQDAQHAARFGR